MKHLSQFLLLMFLTACASNTTPLASLSPAETATATKPATPSAVPTKTEQPTNTPIPDPTEIPATTLLNTEGNVEYEGYFTPATEGAGVPAYDWILKWRDSTGILHEGQDIGNIQVYFSDSIDTYPKITHTQLDIDDVKSIYIGVLNGAFNKYFSELDWKILDEGLQNGTLNVPITYNEKTYDWYPSPESGSKIYFMPYQEDVMGKNNKNGYMQFRNLVGADHYFAGKFLGVDEEGDQVWLMAPKLPYDQLIDADYAYVLNIPLTIALDNKGTDIAGNNKKNSGLDQLLTKFAMQMSPPYFQVITK
jgi:hypothetical protein